MPIAELRGRAPDGTMKEVVTDTGGSVSVALLAGESQQFNRQFGGSVAQSTQLTATGAVNAGPCICYGYNVVVAMSAAATTVYDNASAASGTVRFVIPASTAVGQYFFPVGILCDNGLYASFAGTGTVNFAYVPAA